MKKYLFLIAGLLVAGTHMATGAWFGSCKHCSSSKKTKCTKEKDYTCSQNIAECNEASDKGCKDGECYKPVSPEL